MGRKLTFFPNCGSPSKTLSFRTTSGDLDDMQVASTAEMDSSVESAIRGLSSDRFFFKPGKTSSILDEAKVNKNENEKESVLLPLKESVSMMEMESTDPFLDFKKSMQEMVEADEGLKEWDNLQELLSVYLAVNDNINHGYIIGAFVDLLSVNHSPSSSSCSSSSSSSSSCMNGRELSLMMESSSISSSCSNNNKKIGSKSPESALSFTSFTSSASSSGSGICSSTSNCLSSCSLEEEGDDEDELDHNSPQTTVVSDNAPYSKV